MPSRSSAVTVVIPARFGSSRFPGKPLAMLLGKPLIQHVYEHARSSRGVGQVLIATDDSRIAEAVKGFDGTVVMTTGPFRTGTDRVAAVARQVTGQTLEIRSEEHTSELQSRLHLVCRLLLEKKKKSSSELDEY